MQQRDLGIAYLLCALGFFGFAGLHRLYLGKPATGILWLMTGGLFFLGTLYDVLTLPGQVEQANRRALEGEVRLRRALREADKLDPEVEMLRLAQRHGGRLTTVLAATELGIPLKTAEARLDALLKSAATSVDVEVTDDGVVVYEFKDLRRT